MDKKESSYPPGLDFHLILDPLKHEYQETQNALIIWKALLFCLETDTPPPDWVNSYLKETANRLLEIDTPDKEAPKMIQEALEIKDGRDFNKLRNEIRNKRIFDVADRELHRAGNKTTRKKALKEVRKVLEAEGSAIGPDTINKAYDKQNKIDKQNQENCQKLSDEHKKHS